MQSPVAAKRSSVGRSARAAHPRLPPEIPLRSLKMHPVRRCTPRSPRSQGCQTAKRPDPPALKGGRPGFGRLRDLTLISGGSRGPRRSNHLSNVTVPQDGELAGPDECAPKAQTPSDISRWRSRRMGKRRNNKPTWGLPECVAYDLPANVSIPSNGLWS